MMDSVIIEKKQLEKEQRAADKLTRVLYEYFSITQRIDNTYRNKINKIISNYVHSYYLYATVNELNSLFFDKFYCVYLPELNQYLSDFEKNELANELLILSKYLEKKYGLENISASCIKAYKLYNKELKRIYYVTRELRKYSIVPVLCWDPFIIDINCYKNMKKKVATKEKYIVYEYGFFVLDEVINTNLIFIRDGFLKDFYKVKIDNTLASQMRKGDIAHMSLKRRLFASSWDIIKVKAYYNNYAKPFLFPGGLTSEKI